jgi:hypothetical protein
LLSNATCTAYIKVEYTIATTTADLAASIAKSIEATPAATIVTEMKSAGRVGYPFSPRYFCVKTI